MFYVYEWFVIETNEIFYVGKGSHNRYKCKQHNKFFNDFIVNHNCNSRIIKEFELEEDAFQYEFERVRELKAIGQCRCNIYDGGFGGDTKSWTDEKRKYYSQYNGMKSKKQRQRMSINNPMKNKEVAMKVGKTKRIPVVIDDILFDSVKEGAKYIGTSDIYLTRCLRHKKTGLCKGHIVRYANQHPSQEKSDNSILEGSTTNE